MACQWASLAAFLAGLLMIFELLAPETDMRELSDLDLEAVSGGGAGAGGKAALTCGAACAGCGATKNAALCRACDLCRSQGLPSSARAPGR